MEKIDVSGVYQIRNVINNKIYIGSSKNIYKRWKTHISRLKYNKHCNSYLQSAWNKYGEDNFEFSILEEVNNLDELKNLEQYYIDTLQPFEDRGYNLCKSTKSYMFERKMPDEWYKKIKQKKSEEHILHMRQGSIKKKSVIVFDKYGNYLFTSISVGETIEMLNNKYNITANKGVISGCCRHKYYTVYNMIFLYEKEYLDNNSIINVHINHIKRPTNKQVVSITKDFKTITIYNSIINAANGDKAKASIISRCCSGDYYISNNLYWIYYDEYIQNKDNLNDYIKSKLSHIIYEDIVQLDMRYNKIYIWNSLDDIIKEYPYFKKGTLMDCIRGKSLSAYHYRWILHDDYCSNNYIITTNNGQAKTVLQLDYDYNIVKEWNSCKDIEKSNKDFKSSSIRSVCNGRTKTHKYKNYNWYYKEDFNNLKRGA